MKKILLVFSFLLLTQLQSFAQDLTWKILADVSWERKFNKEYDEYINYPKFGNIVKPYGNKEVIIKGYLLPVEVEGDYIVISAFPFQSCFFCGGAGVESVMEVYLKKKKNVKSLQIKVKGRLELNAADVNHLVYLLKDAEIIEEIN
ncbi:MAG: DUF3299 domain-containing protein [Thermoflexibacter sp.]|jgi:hypothetical protein|nr:DUF3299 domain-containing protein [Thermoflexibacter sp.]